MSFSEVSPFLLSDPYMHLQSSLNPGMYSVPFHIDFGSNSKRVGTYTLTQILGNGQLHTEPTFQVLRKDNSETFEKYQQLQIGYYEFQKFCFLKEDLLNGVLEMREKQPQFVKYTSMEHVQEQCHKVREIIIGQNRRSRVTCIQYIKDKPASTYVQFRLFGERRTTNSNKWLQPARLWVNSMSWCKIWGTF